jgi:hypothetical protein
MRAIPAAAPQTNAELLESIAATQVAFLQEGKLPSISTPYCNRRSCDAGHSTPPYGDDDGGGLGDIAEEGAMKTALGAASAVIFATTVIAFTPTAASAFDIEGLIGTAIALQMGAYGFHGSPYGHARGHVASRHDAGGGNGGVERDARDPDPMPNREAKVALHRQSFDPSAGTAQATERDASAGQMASSGKASNDEPSFHPSR